MPEFLAAVLAKTLIAVLEALLIRLVREIVLMSVRRYQRAPMMALQAA